MAEDFYAEPSDPAASPARGEVNRDGLPIRAGDDVGLAAGMSQDGIPSVHDRSMPSWFEDGRGRRFDLQESRDYHERIEKALLDAGHAYGEAHRAAAEVEHARMRQMGFDPNAVEDFQQRYVDRAAHRARVLGNTTADVTGKPYQDSGENAMRQDGGEANPRYILDCDGRRYTRPMYNKLLDTIESVSAKGDDGRYAVLDPNSGKVLAEGGSRERARARVQELAARLGRRRLQAQLNVEPAQSQQQLRAKFAAAPSGGSAGPQSGSAPRTVDSAAVPVVANAGVGIGAQLNQAGGVRQGYEDEVRKLAEDDSAGRRALKAEARAKTAPMVRGVIKAARGEDLGPKLGTGGTANASNAGWNIAGKALRYGGGALAAGGLAADAYAIAKAQDPYRELAGRSGGLLGGTLGGLGGAVGGTFVAPGAGSVIGGVGGAIGGSALGSSLGYELYDLVNGD